MHSAVLSAATAGRVVLMKWGFSVVWRTPVPSTFTLPVRLCLTTSARLVVLDSTDKELHVLYGGLPAIPEGRVALQPEVGCC